MPDVAIARRVLALAVSGCMLLGLPGYPLAAETAPQAGTEEPVPPPGPPAADPVDPPQPEPSGPAAPASGARAAIIPLIVVGELPDEDKTRLSDALVSGLQRGAFDIVEPVAVQSASPKATKCDAPKCFADVATKNDATHVVRTTITIEDRDYDVRVELLDGKTGTTLASSQEGCEICGVADVSNLIDSAAATLRTKLDALAAGPSTLTINSTPPEVVVAIDGNVVGTTPLEVPVVPGKRVVRVTKEGYIAIEREVTFVEGVQESLSFELEKLPSRLPGRTWGWVSLGIGIAGLGAGVTFTVLHDRDFKHGSNCTGDDVDSREECRFLWNTKWYGLAGSLVGAALITLGIAILVNSPKVRRKGKTDKRRKKANARLGIGPGSVSVLGRF